MEPPGQKTEEHKHSQTQYLNSMGIFAEITTYTHTHACAETRNVKLTQRHVCTLSVHSESQFHNHTFPLSHTDTLYSGMFSCLERKLFPSIVVLGEKVKFALYRET